MMCPECEPVISELREEIRQLRAELGACTDWKPPKEIGLNCGQETAIVKALMQRHGMVQHWAIYEAMRSVPGCYRNEVPLQQTKVLIAKIRRKFEPFGLVIECVWGSGYALSPASRAKLLNWNQQHREAA